MSGRRLAAAAVPTSGPWRVRSETEAAATHGQPMRGGPYLIVPRRPLVFDDPPRPLAIGIERFADAQLIAAAPDLAARLLAVLIVRELRSSDLDPQTQAVTAAAWDLLVRVTPQLEL